MPALRLGEDLRLTAGPSTFRRDYANSGVAVCVHESQRDDPVEPGVGNLVRHRSATRLTDARGFIARTNVATPFGCSTRSGDAGARTTAMRADTSRMSAVRAQVANDLSGPVSIRVRSVVRCSIR